MNKDNIPSLLVIEEVTIAISTAISGAIDTNGGRPYAIQMPAAWTAADLTLQGSYDGITFADVYTAGGSEYLIPAAAARYIILDPVDFAAFRHFKIRSGTTGTPVNQAAARALQLILGPI